ncbi:MAG: integrase family protein [Aeromicrobium sp.]|nr:integrase family protein [Aeromicrobium sp.]
MFPLLASRTSRLLLGTLPLRATLPPAIQTISDWRLSGRAPRAHKIGKDLRFALSDVQVWLEACHERSSGRAAMSRPRIAIGTFGELSFINRPDRRVEVRARYRDWGGRTRIVQATASSRLAAEVALKQKLAERNAFQPVDTTLTPDSPFPALVDHWLADLELEARIAPSTRMATRTVRKLVLPAFAGFALREIGVARCDALLKPLGQVSYAKAKCAKTVLRLAFALAVRHEVIGRNPIDNVSRLHKPRRTPMRSSTK